MCRVMARHIVSAMTGINPGLEPARAPALFDRIRVPLGKLPALSIHALIVVALDKAHGLRPS